MRLDIAEQVFKVRGQRLRSGAHQLTYNGGGTCFDGVESRLITCLFKTLQIFDAAHYVISSVFERRASAQLQ